MSDPSHRQIAKNLQDMIVERQCLLIREANYLRALVGLPPVRAEGKSANPATKVRRSKSAVDGARHPDTKCDATASCYRPPHNSTPGHMRSRAISP